MGDKARGIYEKFTVTRTDGQSEPGKKHEGCDYFVLDWTHDPFAIPALRAYADACEAEYPALARDIRSMCGPIGETSRPEGVPEFVYMDNAARVGAPDGGLIAWELYDAQLTHYRYRFDRIEPSSTGTEKL